MFDSATYQKRRCNLREKVGDGLILILGNNEAPANYPDNTYKFRQDSSFVYFFGHSHPGYAGIIDANSGEEYFFGDDVDMDDIIWMGPQPSVKDLAAQVGIEKSFPFAKLKEIVGNAIARHQSSSSDTNNILSTSARKDCSSEHPHYPLHGNLLSISKKSRCKGY